MAFHIEGLAPEGTPGTAIVADPTCGTCKHHSRPQWPTRGFGTCSEVIRRGMLNIVGQGYLTTHETFRCDAWTDVNAKEVA